VPQLVSNAFDAFVYRTMNGRPQFLLLLRRSDSPLPNTWQAIHGVVNGADTAVDAVLREIVACTAVQPVALYSADYVSQFYDHRSDTIVLSPAFAAEFSQSAQVVHSPEFGDHVWCDLEETTARLPWSAQRWAVRHIYDVIAMGGDDADLYRIA
jgi:dihydroneopterin triphosphate diphosphatase